MWLPFSLSKTMTEIKRSATRQSDKPLEVARYHAIYGSIWKVVIMITMMAFHSPVWSSISMYLKANIKGTHAV